MRAAGVTVLMFLTVGCGSEVIGEGAPVVISEGAPVVISEGAPVDDPYEGPLYVRVSEPDHRDPLVSSGAAGMALECSGDPYSGSTGRNWGVTGGHATAAEALEAFVGDEGASLPLRGYRPERETHDRVLFSYDVGDDTRVAVIVADNITGTSGESGWSMETFAQCDPAEFPPAVTDELGIQVWTNEQGERIPITVIQSSRGPEHCDWDSATFLDLRGDTFVKDPQGVLPPESFSGTFDPNITLPEDAKDTGYRLDGQRLWVAADRSAAFIVTEQGVERWPVATDFGCA